MSGTQPTATALGLTPAQWTQELSAMAAELDWIKSQRHLRGDEHYRQLQALWNGATRPQRAALTELLMLAFCNMTIQKTVKPTEQST